MLIFHECSTVFRSVKKQVLCYVYNVYILLEKMLDLEMFKIIYCYYAWIHVFEDISTYKN